MKRKLNIFVCIMLSLLFVFSSCSPSESEKSVSDGEKSDVNAETSSGGVEKEVSHVYKTDYMQIPESYSLNSSSYNSGNSYTVLDSRVYFFAYETLNPDTYESRQILFSFDKNGENMETEIPDALDDNIDVSLYVPTSDGGYIASYRERTGDSGIYYPSDIIKYSSDGEVEFSLDIENLMNSDVHEIKEGGFSGFQMHAIIEHNGNFYIASNQCIAVVSASGEKIAEIRHESKDILSMLYSQDENKNGKMIVIFYNEETYGGKVPHLIDLENNTVGREIIVPQTLENSSMSFHTGPEYDIYVRTFTGFYGVNSGSEGVLLIDWVNSNILGANILSIAVLSRDNIICISRNDITKRTDIIKLSEAPEGYLPDKQIITLAHFGRDMELQYYVVNFNQINEKYQIVMTDYSQYNTQDEYNKGFTVLTNDIIAGDIPDIIQYYSTTYEGDINDLILKGLCTDLYPFFDDELSRDEYMECLQKPLEYNGKLPLLVSTFYLDVYSAKRENLPQLSDGKWTHDDIVSICNSLEKGQSMFQYRPYDLVDFAYFVDLENIKTDFDNDTFKNILEVAKNYYKSSPPNYSLRLDRLAAQRNNELLIIETRIGSLNAIVANSFMFGTDDVVFFSKPDTDYSSFINIPIAYGITEKSENKEGAWEFLKYLTEFEIRAASSWGGETGFPSRRGEFQAELEKHLDYTYASQTTGNNRTFAKITDDNIQYFSGYDEFWDIKQEYIDNIYTLLENPGFSYELYEQIRTIANEEIWEFYEIDSRTAEQTAKAIQSRANIFISESN